MVYADLVEAAKAIAPNTYGSFSAMFKPSEFEGGAWTEHEFYIEENTETTFIVKRRYAARVKPINLSYVRA